MVREVNLLRVRMVLVVKVALGIVSFLRWGLVRKRKSMRWESMVRGELVPTAVFTKER